MRIVPRLNHVTLGDSLLTFPNSLKLIVSDFFEIRLATLRGNSIFGLQQEADW
jgi:hypothetical protein